MSTLKICNREFLKKSVKREENSKRGYRKEIESKTEKNNLVVEVGDELTGGGRPTCIKIGYSSREPRRVVLPCIKIGYVSAMY